MKVFWKYIDNSTANGLVESDSIEEVSLPMEAILEIEANLRSSAQFLPPGGRKFQGWDVGLLERFEN
jgi:ubiquitin-protein ligase E3 D